MQATLQRLGVLTFLLSTLFLLPSTSMAALIDYDSGLDEWSVTDWPSLSSNGTGAFASSSFTGYTSTNGVAMLRNDNSSGWWIGDVQISTYSSFYADDTFSITVTGATWGGIVNYYTNQATGSNFYAAMNNSVDMFDATGLSIGDSINGTFSWSGSINNIALNYDANNISVPEPAIFALLGLGLAGIGFSRKKKAA